MPEYTRPATWEDLKRLAGLLEEARVEYALVGGYALAAHGLPRMTEDIDNPTAENSRRWILALRQLPDQPTRALDRESDVFAPAHQRPRPPYPSSRQSPSHVHACTGRRSEGLSRACRAGGRLSFGARRPTAAMASMR